jgi:hypothetical protein
MKELVLSRNTAVWLLLIGATVLSWNFNHGLGFDSLPQAGIAILVVTFLKVRFVVFDFMEVRQAPKVLRWISEAWIVLTAVTLIALFLWTPSAALR